MNRRQFLYYLGLSPALLACGRVETSKDSAASKFGDVTILHFTDCHAQLLPIYCREPSNKTGIAGEKSWPMHLTGNAFLDYYGMRAGTRQAHAFTSVDFVNSASVYGKMGGFAHLSTLIKQIRDARGHENTLLLDGGDSWQGSATALWSKGNDMIAASNLLGVDLMTGHWEFTYGSPIFLDNLKRFNGEFIAQNIALTEEALFNRDTETDALFKPYVVKEFNNARIAVIGQAFPYTPIANPNRFIPDWQFGIQEQHLQAIIDRIKKNKEADVLVLLSHNGMAVDLKLAAEVTGLDVILGGHSHDAIPLPVLVENGNGKTWVTNAGSHGKFLGVLDLEVGRGRLRDLRYRLLPIFTDRIEPDTKMQRLIHKTRAPYLERLARPLAVADRLLYRRDTFCGTFDQLILDALIEVNDCQIAFSPGFRWGTALLPGQTILYEDVMNQTAITYPETYTRILSGNDIKTILEDVADNLFNKDPYYRQGGDMVRTGGMRFRCDPDAVRGRRISQMRLADGELIAAGNKYKVSGWAAVGDQATGRPVDEVVVEYLTGRVNG
ncbi:MAG: thiosulfohydrolase SoxB [Gammaproteobacteria bacterium]